jgi:hypothetical protein
LSSPRILRLRDAGELGVETDDGKRLAGEGVAKELLEDRCYTPVLNADLFPITELFIAWSSTPSAANLANEFIDAWAVDGNGFVSCVSPITPLNILLVRDAP